MLRLAVCFVALALHDVAPVCGEEPRFFYESPFHPELCDNAIRLGREAIEHFRTEKRGRLTLAEGYYCRGLLNNAQDLHEAARLFREALVAEPADLFACLELAQVLYRLSPTSGEIRPLLLHAVQLLAVVDVGAAREEITRRIDSSLAALNPRSSNNDE